MPAPLTLPVRYTTRKPPCGTPIRSGHPLAPRGGLGGIWPLNEGAGGTVRDATRQNPPATVTGATWVPSPLGRALSLSGTGSVTVPNSAAQQIVHQLTVSVWCTITGGAANYRTLVCKPAAATWTAPYALWDVRLNTADQLECWLNDGGNPAADYATSTATFAADGRPHLFTLTYDGATIRTYDGATLLATKAFAATITTGSQPLVFGSDPSNTELWVGLIGLVTILPRALSPAEVRSLYLAPFQMF